MGLEFPKGPTPESCHYLNYLGNLGKAPFSGFVFIEPYLRDFLVRKTISHRLSKNSGEKF